MSDSLLEWPRKAVVDGLIALLLFVVFADFGHCHESTCSSKQRPGCSMLASKTVRHVLAPAQQLQADSIALDDLDADEIELMEADFARRGKAVLAAIDSSQSQPVNKSQKKIGMHVHIHNSAGTWMCTMAGIFGESISKEKFANCNMMWKFQLYGQTEFLDGPWTRIHNGSPRQCLDRVKEAAKEHLSFFMIERWLNFEHGDWCPNNFAYSIIVRDPVKRAKTTLRLNGFNNSHALAKLLEAGSQANKTPTNDWMHSHAAYSDLMVRTLNGPEAMSLPLGSLTEEHLQLAKDRLGQFDAILAIPTLYTDMVQMAHVRGWPYPNGAASWFHVKSKVVDMTKELERLLVEYNVLDQNLYQFGLELARTRSEALLPSYS